MGSNQNAIESEFFNFSGQNESMVTSLYTIKENLLNGLNQLWAMWTNTIREFNFGST